MAPKLTATGTDENIPINRDFGLGINSRGFAVTKTLELADPLNESRTQESQQETQHQDHVETGPSSPLSSTGSSDFEISKPGHLRKARRSSCPPLCTSSPDSNHSSETLFGTPCHSEASSSPTFIDSHRTHDKHENLDNYCWLVLAEHLKAEEKDAENKNWEIVVGCMKLAHQTEIAELQSQIFVAETILEARDVELANEKDDHEADLNTIETLRKERSDVRKRLSERNTELRNAKKTVRNLSKSLEETLERGSIYECSPEFGNVEEEAPRLARVNSPHATEVRELQKKRDAGVQLFEETTGEINLGNLGKREEKGETHKTESSEERRLCQEGLKQQVLDWLTLEELRRNSSQAAATGEEKDQATLQEALGINDDDDDKGSARVKKLEKENETLEENLEYATDEVARLRLEAKSTSEEMKRLRAVNHFAQLGVRWRLDRAERRAAELEKELVELERKFRDAVKDGKKREM